MIRVSVKGRLPDLDAKRISFDFLRDVGVEGTKRGRLFAPERSGRTAKSIDWKHLRWDQIEIAPHTRQAHFTEGGTRAHTVEPSQKEALAYLPRPYRTHAKRVRVSGTRAVHYMRRAVWDRRDQWKRDLVSRINKSL